MVKNVEINFNHPSPSLEKEVLHQLLRLSENPPSERLYKHFFCFGRKRFVSMVRPTVTKDVPGCNNRFAPLGENYASYQIRRSLEVASGKDPPPSLRAGRRLSPGSIS